jgi:hypothetical protein
LCGSTGLADGEFGQPSKLTLDPSRNVLAPDSGNDRIEKFTNDSKFIIKWGSAGLDDD